LDGALQIKVGATTLKIQQKYRLKNKNSSKNFFKWYPVYMDMKKSGNNRYNTCLNMPEDKSTINGKNLQIEKNYHH
jgi:hypothetical protein